MYVRCGVSAFAVEARGRRPAWVTCEPAPRTAKEDADDYIHRDGRKSGDRCVVRAGYDSGWRFADRDRARNAGSASSKHNGDARQFCSRAADSKIAPGPGSRVTARDLSLARCRASESAHLV